MQNSTVKDAFPRILFDFGYSDEGFTIHRHDRLERPTSTSLPLGKRQVTAETDTTTVVATTIAVPSASATPNDTVNTGSLAFEELDTTFMLPGNVSLPFDLGCQNCSGKGEIILSTVHFEFNSLGTLFSGEDDDLVKTGAVQLDLKGFEMSIGLRATPEETDEDINIFQKEIIGVEVSFAHCGLRLILI